MPTNKNLGKNLVPTTGNKAEIGIDQNQTLVKDLVKLATNSSLDLSSLQDFSNISQSREQVYQLIDTMAADSDIATIIEAYVDEICEPNENGDIVSVESTDPEILKFISYILQRMQVDKHIRNWATKLVKYGDVYWRLFDESEMRDESEDVELFGGPKNRRSLTETLKDQAFGSDEEYIDLNTSSYHENKELKENVIIAMHDKNSHIAYYTEAERNPAEMFELTKNGKTHGFIKAPTNVLNTNKGQDTISSYYYQYKVNSPDVTLYQPSQYVHAYVDDNSSRIPEEVSLISSATSDKDSQAEAAEYTYSVRRGQSLLYNGFLTWRELKLLETSVLLNRLTKSSVIRILEIEVGNLPDTQIRGVLQDVKNMIEQKAAINVGTSMSEYTMPGPVENTIYLPTRGEIGKINIQELGTSDVDPKSLLDLDYFNNKLYASFRTPKAFFNFTDDGAGFNGGESLAILSSGFGKKVKRFQNTLCQGITNMIHVILLDRGLDNYVNKFTIKMQAPLTKEELDRRQAKADEINTIRDLMGIIRDEVEDNEIRLEMLKLLLKNSPQSEELITLLDSAIVKAKNNPIDENTSNTTGTEGGRSLKPIGTTDEPNEENETSELEQETEQPVEEPEEIQEPESEYLPSFDELGIEDATDLSNNA